MASENQSGAKGVALIAVHGVADQKPGVTARQIAALMVNNAALGDQAVRYSAGVCDTLILAAPPLTSIQPPAPAGQETAGWAWIRRLRRSASSDFLRAGWGDAAGDDPSRPNPALMGVAFSDYLLYKNQSGKPDPEIYETARIRTTRSAAGSADRPVDIVEMYWADLSRLSGAIPNIVSELFTLVFRLSRLARDTVDLAAHAAPNDGETRWGTHARWKGLAVLQRSLDWYFAAILANLFLQLLLVGITIAGLGTIARDPRIDGEQIRHVLVWLVPLPLVAVLCYRYSADRVVWHVAFLITVALPALLAKVPTPWVVGGCWIVVLSVLCDQGLRVADQRFPGTRSVGLLFLFLNMAGLAYFVWHPPEQGMHSAMSAWIIAGLRMVEMLLGLIGLWWILFPALAIPWLLVGMSLMWERKARAVVITGQLGLLVSIASFVILLMGVWAAGSDLLGHIAVWTDYQRWLFPATPNAFIDGKLFLENCYAASTAGFVVVALPVLLLFAYLAIAFIPSVIAEFKLQLGDASMLGRWLSGGYGWLNGVVFALVAGCAAFTVFFSKALLGAASEPICDAKAAVLAHTFGVASANMLSYVVLGAAGLAAFLTAFSTLLSRYMPWLRLPLDVALDVDNHFREFPRKAIPRARIFARFTALLEELDAQGYSHIVIVAHSQGSVLTVDLLRYFKYRAERMKGAQPSDRIVQLWSTLEKKIVLLTAGSPLHQLYEARFPSLYSWQLGPQPDDVGAYRWINVYASGDYVGRWLLPSHDNAECYEKSAVLPSEDALTHDYCVGAGGHLRYFDSDRVDVAALIDRLVQTPPA